MEYTSFTGESPIEYPPVERLSAAPDRGPLAPFERRIDSPCAEVIKHTIDLGLARPPVIPGDSDGTFQAVLDILRTMLIEEAKPLKPHQGWIQGLWRTATDDGRLSDGEFGRALDAVMDCWVERAKVEQDLGGRPSTAQHVTLGDAD
jgi:hypothetical protein